MFYLLININKIFIPSHTSFYNCHNCRTNRDRPPEYLLNINKGEYKRISTKDQKVKILRSKVSFFLF